MSKRLNKLREKRGAMLDDLNGIIAKIDALRDKIEKDGDREPTEAERSDLKGFNDRVTALKADLDRIDGEIADEQKLEDVRRAAAVPLGGSQGDDGRGAGLDGERKRIVIPAQAKHRYAKLKAFKGATAEEDAYISGMFLLATLGRGLAGTRPHLHSMGEKAAKWLLENGMDVYAKAQNEGSNTAGGYLVPTQMETAIIDLREQFGTFRRFAGVSPMASDKQTQPMRTGGLTAYWVDEAAQITESEKTWGQVTLSAKKLAALSRMSSELNEDAIISIADDLAREMAYAFAVSEDDAGWNGTGSSAYGGIVGVRTKIITAPYTASVHTPASGLDTFEEITKGDLEKVMGMLPNYVTNPRWYISKVGYFNMLLRLATAAGGVTATEMVNGVVNYNYMGIPVAIDQTLPKVLTDLSDVAMAFYGDLSLAVKMGERRGITIALSDQRYWEYDQIGIRATERIDIVAHSLGSTTEAGPLIALVGE